VEEGGLKLRGLGIVRELHGRKKKETGEYHYLSLANRELGALSLQLNGQRATLKNCYLNMALAAWMKG